MNKSKKIKLLISSFSVLATTGVIATTLTSCGKSGGGSSDQPIAGTTIKDATAHVFSTTNINPVVKNALTIKLSTATITNLTINAVTTDDVFYNYQNNSSKANVSGTININGVKNTFTLKVTYDIFDKLYTTTPPETKTAWSGTTPETKIPFSDITPDALKPASDLTPAMSNLTPDTLKPASDLTPGAISNLTPEATIPWSGITPATAPTFGPSVNVFSKGKVSLQVNQALINKLGLGKFDDVKVNSVYNSEIHYFSLINTSSLHVSGTVNTSDKINKFTLILEYHFNTNEFTATTPVLTATTNKTNPAIEVFSKGKVSLQVNQAMTDKFGASNFSDIRINNFDKSEIVYDQGQNTSVLHLSGTVYQDGRFNKFTLGISYNFKTDKYNSTKPILEVGSETNTPTTEIFSKTNVASQVNQALTDRFGAFGVDSQFRVITINKFHKSLFTYNALLNQSIQYVTGVVNVNGEDQQYIVGMTYHGNTGKFETPTLEIFIRGNSSDNWNPAVNFFSKGKVSLQVHQALINKLGNANFNNLDLSATNFQNIGYNKIKQISTLIVSGTVKINNKLHLLDLTLSYNFKTNTYSTSKIFLQTSGNSSDNWSPAVNFLSKGKVSLQVHQALINKLGNANFNNLDLSATNFQNIGYNKIKQISTLIVSGTVKINNKSHLLDLTLSYNFKTKTYSTSKIFLQTSGNSSDNWSPAVNFLSKGKVSLQVHQALINKLGNANFNNLDLSATNFQNIGYNKIKQISTLIVSGTVKINNKSHLLDLTLSYNFKTKTYSTSKIFLQTSGSSSDNWSPISNLFSKGNVTLQTKAALIRKLKNSNFDNLDLSGTSFQNIDYNKTTQISTLIISGTVNINGIKNKISLTLSYNFKTNTYSTSKIFLEK